MKLFRNNMQDNYNSILKNAMKDTLRILYFVLPLIAAFEFILAFYSLFIREYSTISVLYSITYGTVFLFALSSFLYLKQKKDNENHPKRILRVLISILIIAMIWSLSVTVLDAISYEYFSSTLFMVTMLVLPIIAFLRLRFWLVFQSVGYLLFILISIHFDVIPFDTIFETIPVMVLTFGITYHLTKLRLSLYTQQVSLSEMLVQYKYYYSHDKLTGVANRYAFNEYIKEISHNKDAAVSIAILDIDRFKQINDTHGHLNGDIVLKKVAKKIKLIVGSDGEVFRWGGEEFAIIFKPEVDPEMICLNLLNILREESIEFEGNSCNITVSIGLALSESGRELNTTDIVKIADKNTYIVKNNGRNNIHITRF